MIFLPAPEWHARASQEAARVSPFLEAHLARRRRGEKHPVWDFLFEYYPFKASLPVRFSPGVGFELEGAGEFLGRTGWSATPRGAMPDAAKIVPARWEEARRSLELLEATHNRAARHDCFGWHEWAMVYRTDETRHALPLRLSGRAIGELLEAQTLRCSHFDAVRFWTPDALSLQSSRPAAHDRADWEQPGCVHANMDLYKFAARFAPWIASALVVEAFLLARDARELDMCASPYDLAPFGFSPILLETPEGRREYATKQRAIAERATPIRAQLIAAYRGLLALAG